MDDLDEAEAYLARQAAARAQVAPAPVSDEDEAEAYLARQAAAAKTAPPAASKVVPAASGVPSLATAVVDLGNKWDTPSAPYLGPSIRFAGGALRRLEDMANFGYDLGGDLADKIGIARRGAAEANHAATAADNKAYETSVGDSWAPAIGKFAVDMFTGSKIAKAAQALGGLSGLVPEGAGFARSMATAIPSGAAQGAFQGTINSAAEQDTPWWVQAGIGALGGAAGGALGTGIGALTGKYLTMSPGTARAFDQANQAGIFPDWSQAVDAHKFARIARSLLESSPFSGVSEEPMKRQVGRVAADMINPGSTADRVTRNDLLLAKRGMQQDYDTWGRTVRVDPARLTPLLDDVGDEAARVMNPGGNGNGMYGRAVETIANVRNQIPGPARGNVPMTGQQWAFGRTLSKQLGNKDELGNVGRQLRRALDDALDPADLASRAAINDRYAPAIALRRATNESGDVNLQALSKVVNPVKFPNGHPNQRLQMLTDLGQVTTPYRSSGTEERSFVRRILQNPVHEIAAGDLIAHGAAKAGLLHSIGALGLGLGTTLGTGFLAGRVLTNRGLTQELIDKALNRPVRQAAFPTARAIGQGLIDYAPAIGAGLNDFMAPAARSRRYADGGAIRGYEDGSEVSDYGDIMDMSQQVMDVNRLQSQAEKAAQEAVPQEVKIDYLDPAAMPAFSQAWNGDQPMAIGAGPTGGGAPLTLGTSKPPKATVKLRPPMAPKPPTTGGVGSNNTGGTSTGAASGTPSSGASGPAIPPSSGTFDWDAYCKGPDANGNPRGQLWIQNCLQQGGATGATGEPGRAFSWEAFCRQPNSSGVPKPQAVIDNCLATPHYARGGAIASGQFEDRRTTDNSKPWDASILERIHMIAAALHPSIDDVPPTSDNPLSMALGYNDIAGAHDRWRADNQNPMPDDYVHGVGDSLTYVTRGEMADGGDWNANGGRSYTPSIPTGPSVPAIDHYPTSRPEEAPAAAFSPSPETTSKRGYNPFDTQVTMADGGHVLSHAKDMAHTAHKTISGGTFPDQKPMAKKAVMAAFALGKGR